MSQTEDTVATTETEQPTDNGTVIEPQADSSEVKAKEQEIDRGAYEQLQKELNQTKQELNLRRNKEKEQEAERLASEGKWKELAEQRLAELDEIKATQEQSEQQKAVADFRKGVLSGYDKDVQDLAESLGLSWDGPGTDDEAFGFPEAEVQFKSKLDALAAKLGKTTQAPTTESTEEVAPEISANNPSTGPADRSELDQLKAMSAADLRKMLPKADSR